MHILKAPLESDRTSLRARRNGQRTVLRKRLGGGDKLAEGVPFVLEHLKDKGDASSQALHCGNGEVHVVLNRKHIGESDRTSCSHIATARVL